MKVIKSYGNKHKEKASVPPYITSRMLHNTKHYHSARFHLIKLAVTSTFA